MKYFYLVVVLVVAIIWGVWTVWIVWTTDNFPENQSIVPRQTLVRLGATTTPEVPPPFVPPPLTKASSFDLTILSTEVEKDTLGNDERVYIVARILDTNGNGFDFDYAIDGGTLKELKGDFGNKVFGLLRAEAIRKYNTFFDDIPVLKEILDNASITTKFGNDKVLNITP